MTVNQTELVRRVSLRMGYAGADFDANGNTQRIISEAVVDAHAELTERKKVTWDIDLTPRKYVSALVRYMTNEAQSYVDRSRSVQEYEAERTLAWRDICRVVTRSEPTLTAEEQETQDELEAIRHI